jgi:KUP system potassium uptake protein
VTGFGSSSALAGAYGIAVASTMVRTAVLLQAEAAERWKWLPLAVATMTLAFVGIEPVFLGTNVLELAGGEGFRWSSTSACSP